MPNVLYRSRRAPASAIAASIALALAAAAHAQPLDPIAWYRFQGNLLDSAGSADGQLFGTVFFPPGVCGGPGQCARFAGTGDVRFPSGLGNFGTGDFTIALWLRLQPSSQPVIEVLSKRTMCGYQSMFDIRVVGGRPLLEIYRSLDDRSNSGVWLIGDVRDGAWRHIAFTRTKGVVTGYVGGGFNAANEDETDNIDNFAPLILSGGPCIGIDGTVALSGDVDELMLFDRALSGAEILGLFFDFGACPADFDHNCTVNSTDVSEFINTWFQDQVKGELLTDWDGNGVVNSTDVSEFINTWFDDIAAGCGG